MYTQDGYFCKPHSNIHVWHTELKSCHSKTLYNAEDVGPTLSKCYTNALCLLGMIVWYKLVTHA